MSTYVVARRFSDSFSYRAYRTPPLQLCTLFKSSQCGCCSSSHVYRSVMKSLWIETAHPTPYLHVYRLKDHGPASGDPYSR